MYNYPFPKDDNYFQPMVAMPQNHSMSNSLEQYLNIKIHPIINLSKVKKVYIFGDFERNKGISLNEKGGKLFNYMRPTAFINEDNIAEVHCFPGIDYVFHFSNIIKSYAAIKNKNIMITCSLPTELQCWNELEKSSFANLPKVDTVIMGYVEGLEFLSKNKEWLGNGNFRYKYVETKSGQAILLGCKHTYWGEIAGRIVMFLSLLGVKRVIYSGKLGTLEPSYIPNQTIATGSESILPNGQIIRWDNMFESLYSPQIKKGIHITVPSVLQETKLWVEKNKKVATFVDPEIGHMAYAAQQTGVQFSYLHIISDNLTRKYLFDLSNERIVDVIHNRTILLKIIGGAIINL